MCSERQRDEQAVVDDNAGIDVANAGITATWLFWAEAATSSAIRSGSRSTIGAPCWAMVPSAPLAAC